MNDRFLPPYNITLDCDVCKTRKLQMVSFLDLGKYQPREEGKGRNLKLVYSGVCRVCELKQQGK
jgi:hypothetical protein